MNIRFFVICLFLSLLFIVISPQVNANTSVNLFQLTSDGSQQKDAFIYKNLAVYTNFGGSQGIDIWAYNLRKQNNYPLIVRAGDQFVTGFYDDLVVYEDVDGASNYDVRLYYIDKKKDLLIAGGAGAQTSGVTNGEVVAYINGGACGSLNIYDLRKKTTTQIEPSTCHPIRIWDNIIVYPIANSNGTDIRGYNLRKNQAFDIATATDFQEVPNIFENYVVWLQRTSGAYGDPNSIVLKNIRTGEEKTIYESSTDTLNWPAVSEKYVVWSQSSAQHVNGIMGANLKTGEVFEIQPQGSHQNSHTIPSIWTNTAVWMSFQSGGGDIYGAELKR